MLLPNRNHHRLPILFPEFSSRFDVTTAGQMKEKWRQACRIPIYLSTPRRATFECIYAGMRVRSSFSTSSSFFFISFLSFFGWTSIYSPATRASNMNLLALVFLRDDRYSVRHRVKYESHRELETNVLKSGVQRPPLFRLFSNVRTPRSAWSAHVYRARLLFGSRAFFWGEIMLNI